VRVVGVDYDAEAAGHARSSHGDGSTGFLRGALTALPLVDGSVGLVTSMQVLEHIWTPAEYVRELARVAGPDGWLVLSTPNRITFSPGLARLAPPPNAYHCREYDAAELALELGRWLPGWDVELVGLHAGTRLRAWEAAHGRLLDAVAEPVEEWSPALRELVVAVTVDDFTLGPADDGCLDLVAAVGPAA
jgi:SAM-dependent methyltransferase